MTTPGLTLALMAFRPVTRFWLDPASVQAGMLAGYAAPDQGPHGCAVKLMAGDTLFAATKAWAFSQAASTAGVQDGWAGFHIHGLLTAMALNPAVELRCAVSDATLASFDPASLPTQTEPPRNRPLDAASLHRATAAAYGCSDLQQVLPIAQRYRDQQGDRAFMEASYRWLLHRTPATQETLGFLESLESLGTGWHVMDVWNRMLASDEFRGGPGLPLLGPYEPGFPFPAR